MNVCQDPQCEGYGRELQDGLCVTIELEICRDNHVERMLDGGDATFGRTDDGYEDPRSYA